MQNTPMRPIDGALYMVSRGFKIFPCKAGEKVPAFANWQDWATTDQQKIASWNTANPRSNWAVFCGGSNLVVIDLDKKENADGETTLSALEQKHGILPVTLTVKTPSGGKHLYFSGSGSNTQSKIGLGIDTRGKGGYVLAPCSKLCDKEGKTTGVYELVNDAQIPPLPDWIAKLINKQKTTPQQGIAPEYLDQPHHHADIIKYLTTTTPAVEGQGGDQRTFEAACMVRDLGASEQAALDLMLDHYNPKCSPPWEFDDLKTKIHNAYRYAENKQAGAKTVEAEFYNTTDNQIKTTLDGFKLFDTGDIQRDSLPPFHWILGTRYIKSYISTTIAAGGTGKSMLAVIEAIAIALGRNDIAGDRVYEQNNVWLHNTEDPLPAIQHKVNAACDIFGINLTDLKGKFFITSGLDSHTNIIIAVESENDRGSIVPVQAHIDLIEKTIDHHKIGVFIADPFIRLHAVSENDNNKIDKVIKPLSALAHRKNIAISLSHHTPKLKNENAEFRGNQEMARGATALINSCRVAHTLDTMNADECRAFAIDPAKRWKYVRLDPAKGNLAPPAEKALWFEKLSHTPIHLDTYKSPQSVGILKPVTFDVVVSDKSALEYLGGLLIIYGDDVPVATIANELYRHTPDCNKFRTLIGRGSTRKGGERISINTLRKDIVMLVERNQDFDDCPYRIEKRGVANHIITAVEKEDK